MSSILPVTANDAVLWKNTSTVSRTKLRKAQRNPVEVGVLKKRKPENGSKKEVNSSVWTNGG